ncbi:adenosine deaminase [Clostridiaceae bacterium HSG29]|nr:adenosine deaminase [Clostridiaceae bacterium HSG29]
MKNINLPKIELHSHLDGSINPKTIFDLGKKTKINLPTDSFDSFVEYVRAPKNCDSLKTYLERFVLPIEVMQTKENLERIAYEYILNVEESNVKYVEVRFAPIYHINNGLTIDEVIASVIKGLSSGTKKTGIRNNLIICGIRSMNVEKNIEIFKISEKYLGQGVIAVDLAGNEADFPPIIHKKAFDLAKNIGFKITIHAGETGCHSNIATSINELHATRIGHGVSAINDTNTIKLLKDKNITLEVCPTSNIQTKSFESFEKHPFKKLLDLNVNVTLNTDNMTVSNTTLNNEYNIMKNTFNLSNEDFIKIYKTSVNASFTDASTKKELLKYI